MAPMTEHQASGAADVTRIGAGFIWLAGAAWNAVVTIRMSDPYGWLEQSPVPVYRWFFGELVGARPAFWTGLLVAGELAIGVLTLARGRWARLGLAGGSLFSALLCSTASPYTLVMGPYALLLAWLARREYRRSLVDRLRPVFGRRNGRTKRLPA